MKTENEDTNTSNEATSRQFKHDSASAGTGSGGERQRCRKAKGAKT